jgi:hypothetical protein
MFLSSDVYADLYSLRYVSRGTDKYKLRSLAVNICSLGFVRGTFVCFL